jgi:hypothetical protein
VVPFLVPAEQRFENRSLLIKEPNMNPHIAFVVLSFFLIILNSGYAHAAWSESKEIISGGWGRGVGQFGTRSEGGFSVWPSIEVITPEKDIIVSDPVNRKQMVFSSEGRLTSEVKWDAAPGKEGKALPPLSQKDRQAIAVHSVKINANTYRITVVFPDKNVILESGQDIKIVIRDANGFLYGITADRVVVRFDRSGKRSADLIVPTSHEALIPVPGRRSPRGVYIYYGEPVIAPDGDIYLLQRSDEKCSILRWSWQE